jgi:FAD/FMN-containing dehydrogenase
MKQRISWGRYPEHKIDIKKFHDFKFQKNNSFIPFGNGRSYGDSCINDNIIDTKCLDRIISFDIIKGEMIVQSGVLLSSILNCTIKKGWFLGVTPGTKYITIGGAIASDVHGKNHHLDGCFSNYVEWIKIKIPNGETIKCSKIINREFFYATCGGMGLTGIIVEAKIRLKRIKSKNIDQKIIRTKNLKETFDVFESIKNDPYSVAWIDCLVKGNKIGRSIIMSGKFSEDGDLRYVWPIKINIPIVFPSFLLNKFSVKLFNWLYYNRLKKDQINNKTDFNSFFFPLDSVLNWNRIYGKNGFTQYQFILPKKNSYIGLKEVLNEIALSGKGSFLAVLKLYGKENDNYLSFPMEGYSLALDFKIEPGIFEFLNKLDKIITKHKGRIYLSKDVRVSKKIFEKGYPRINIFRNFRKKNKLTESINSLQSQRVGI